MDGEDDANDNFMMINCKRGLAVLLVLCAQWVAAQGLADVMQYSRQDPLGSARTMGMGGAMTALGADLGAIWSNPAGLGMYRSSDISFSVAPGAGGASTEYLGNKSVTAEPHVIVGQLGVALTMPMLSPTLSGALLHSGTPRSTTFTKGPSGR